MHDRASLINHERSDSERGCNSACKALKANPGMHGRSRSCTPCGSDDPANLGTERPV
ncbi:hypothetical protein HanIR_Chr02g0059851 [Helianthus annuus]|nr:hypothetical protein HanIR_Chr02g0059851 [Helianthus annuus]